MVPLPGVAQVQLTWSGAPSVVSHEGRSSDAFADTAWLPYFRVEISEVSGKPVQKRHAYEDVEEYRINFWHSLMIPPQLQQRLGIDDPDVSNSPGFLEACENGTCSELPLGRFLLDGAPMGGNWFDLPGLFLAFPGFAEKCNPRDPGFAEKFTAGCQLVITVSYSSPRPMPWEVLKGYTPKFEYTYRAKIMTQSFERVKRFQERSPGHIILEGGLVIKIVVEGWYPHPHFTKLLFLIMAGTTLLGISSAIVDAVALNIWPRKAEFEALKYEKKDLDKGSSDENDADPLIS